MSNFSFEYNLFSLGDKTTTVDDLSEMVVSMCMEDDIPEHFSEMLRCVINALYYCRLNEESQKDREDAKPVDIVKNPDDLFMQTYEKLCDKAGIAVCDGDAWWEDHWPTDAFWHKHEIVQLTRLQIGKVEAHRSYIRQYMQRRQETETVEH